MRNYTPTGTFTQIEARKQKRFLNVLLTNGGFVERAIRECKTSRRWLNQSLEVDEEFAALFATIRDQNNEKIEEEIYRRAVVGNDKPQVWRGVPTGHYIKEYSDVLLMFYAKANMPGKYRDLPQKGSELTDDELNERIGAWMRKRKDEAPEPTNAVN
jgi:hypothetical protein